VFTKYVSSLTGALDTVELPSDAVDWKVELVAVIGTGGRDIPEALALEHVAGYMVGQDLSDRALQFSGGGAPQFSVAKSHKGFAPTGPWITSSDEIADPGKLTMTRSRGDEVLPHGSTSNLVFDLPTLIHHLSSIVELYPGDLIFTGTPDGVGFGRSPQQYLVPGDELVSSIEGLGEIRQRFVPRIEAKADSPRRESEREAWRRHARNEEGRPREAPARGRPPCARRDVTPASTPAQNWEAAHRSRPPRSNVLPIADLSVIFEAFLRVGSWAAASPGCVPRPAILAVTASVSL
jgi:hypothetical protein